MDEPHDALGELLCSVTTYGRGNGVYARFAVTLLPRAAIGRTNGSKGIGPKAWRWVGEMEEIAAAFSVRPCV
jgi:hypothetical protein